MSKIRFRLRLVAPARPQALTMEEKRAASIEYLRQRNLYVLDKDSARPKWGIPQAGAKK